MTAVFSKRPNGRYVTSILTDPVIFSRKWMSSSIATFESNCPTLRTIDLFLRAVDLLLRAVDLVLRAVDLHEIYASNLYMLK